MKTKGNTKRKHELAAKERRGHKESEERSASLYFYLRSLRSFVADLRGVWGAVSIDMRRTICKASIMGAMIEVYYLSPADSKRESRVTEKATASGGSLTDRDVPDNEASRTIILTYEFDDWTKAEQASAEIRQLGENVEGPCDY